MIRNNIEKVNERIARACRRAGRPPESVTLVAVSKTFPAEMVREAYEAGLRCFGENRIQEAEGKIAQLADLDITWHLIGHLQTNKAKKAAELFHTVESLDSLRLAQKLDQAQAAKNQPLPVLVQVDLAGEETKSGMKEVELPGFLRQVSELAHLRVRGLMTLPPYHEDPERVRPYFRRLRELAERLASENISHVSFNELSMGMSHDFEIAIEEGATIIRVGSVIFGERTKR